MSKAAPQQQHDVRAASKRGSCLGPPPTNWHLRGVVALDDVYVNLWMYALATGAPFLMDPLMA